MFRAHVLIVRRSKLYIFWYHHTETSEWFEIVVYSFWCHQTCRCDGTRDSIVQFSPPNDEYLCSKHVEA